MTAPSDPLREASRASVREAALHLLVAQWRWEAKEQYESQPASDATETNWEAYRRCADLLEAILIAQPAPDPHSGEAALIAKWRAADSASFDQFVGGAFRRCADELEALLAAPRTEE